MNGLGPRLSTRGILLNIHMTHDSIKLISDIVALFPGEPGLSARANAALALSIEGSELPPSVVRTLDAFRANTDVQRLRDVQEAVARAGLRAIGVPTYID